MKPEGKMKQLDTVTTDNNVMPSMVVRQQRIQMGTSAMQQVGSTTRRPLIGAHHLLPGEEPQISLMAPPPPPPPTFSLIKAAKEMNHNNQQQQQQQFDQDGLVLPKRVLHHPISMAQPIIRDLNRELKFNQVRGKNVLDQKSELKKALEKLQDNKRKKEAEQERLSRRSSLELRLEERAERIAKQSSVGPQQATTNKSVAVDDVAESSSSSSSAAVSAATTCKPLSNFTIRSITR